MGHQAKVEEAGGDFEIEHDGEEAVLRVKPTSSPQLLAAAISHAVAEDEPVVLRAIGAGAVNQAVKACAIARGYAATRGIDLVVVPSFKTITIVDRDTQEPLPRSAVVLNVGAR